MIEKNSIIIVGSGSLARSICYSLPLVTQKSFNVFILSRSFKAAKEISLISNTRSKLNNSNLTFFPKLVDWDDEELLKRLFIDTKAKIIFLASSLQSFWEISRQESKWSYLVQESGFGLTLPLQAFLAVKLGYLLKKHDFSGTFINACYPDAVNPLLKSLKIDIACGIGNISIIDALMKSNMPIYDDNEIKILAHHFHLGVKSKELLKNNPVKVWVNDSPFKDETSFHSSMSDVSGAELNQITGLTAAKMIGGLMNRDFTKCHAPGPIGLPGGYPVKIGNFQVKIDLPGDFSLEKAIKKNQEWSLLDGVIVENDRVCFNSRTSQLLSDYDFPFSEGFDSHKINEVTQNLVFLRDKLRLQQYQ